jgi:hypothetical protein
MILNQLFTEGTNWHTDPEQQSMDATRRARLGREREPEGSEEIDARIRADNNARQEYAETGRFWLKRKDSQEHISDAFVGKVAANAAAVELLKQQPELRGNLVITAYGPGEQQPVTEGKVKELGQDLKDKALGDAEFKARYGKTRAEVRAAMREKQGVAEGERGRGRPPGRADAWDTTSGKVGRVEKTAQGIRHHADPSRYGGTEAEPELNRLDKGQVNKMDNALDVKWDRESKRYFSPIKVDEQDKVGNMDADAFDAAMARLKKLAGSGPMKTVYDPNKRVYRNVPTAVQPSNKK